MSVSKLIVNKLDNQPNEPIPRMVLSASSVNVEPSLKSHCLVKERGNEYEYVYIGERTICSILAWAIYTCRAGPKV